ncbi:uncharacterized protein BKA55DRAFT_681620 [Fusarium redolens]|uniref:CFEM domain-containing protein n=1 Tax=Fusarium redolens TaxID=48865 RepID=A0A9P9FX59_FUSRE|nr:uncharacterized protein BKA55DRAFT_681620 [Fusarium redolens]KAH7208474.1 hypothetical protein BKA55DRAFT_681620 [Fusarium redolens]
MKLYARLAVALTVIRFVKPKLVLPSCAQACLTTNADVFTDGTSVCSLLDRDCQCTNEEYLSTAHCCLHEQCSDSDRKKAEEYSRSYCRHAGHSMPSGIVCSTVASSSADLQSSETSAPEQSSMTEIGSIATAESTTEENSGSETATKSASEPSSLPTSDGTAGSSSTSSETTKDNHALTLQLGLGLGIGLGVPLVIAVIYLALLQRKKLKQQGTLNNQEPQVSFYQAPPPQGFSPLGYPPSSHLPQGSQVSSPQVQAHQEQFEPHKYEHESSGGVEGLNRNQYEMMGNIPPPRHELPSNNPETCGELPPDTRPHNELP